MPHSNNHSSSYQLDLKYNNYLSTAFVVLIANLGMLLFGYEIGATSWTVYIIESLGAADDDNGDNYYYRVVSSSSVLLGFTAAICSLASLLTYLLLLYEGNSISKGKEILLSSLFYCLGGILQSVSSGMDWESSSGFVTLLIGRFIYGIGIALTVHATPQYIAEVTNDDTRSNFSSTVEAMVMIGMTIGFAVGYFADESNSWTITFEVSYILAAIMFVGSWWLPLSPIYMLNNGYNTEEIVKSMQILFPGVTVNTVDALRQSVVVEDQRREKYINQTLHWLRAHGYENRFLMSLLTPQLQAMLYDRKSRLGFFLVLALNLMKVLTGQTVILYYLTTIFSSIYSSTSEVEDYSIGYIAARAGVALVMVGLVHLAGRRTWLLASTFLLFASQFIVYFGFSFGPTILEQVIFLAGFGFEIGLGSVAYLITVEVVPFFVRSTANAAANSALFAVYFATVFLFPVMVDWIGLAYVFLMTSALSLVSFALLFFYLPETKNVPIEESFHLVDEKFSEAPPICCCCLCCGEGDGDDNSMESDALVGHRVE